MKKWSKARRVHFSRPQLFKFSGLWPTGGVMFDIPSDQWDPESRHKERNNVLSLWNNERWHLTWYIERPDRSGRNWAALIHEQGHFLARTSSEDSCVPFKNWQDRTDGKRLKTYLWVPRQEACAHNELARGSLTPSAIRTRAGEGQRLTGITKYLVKPFSNSWFRHFFRK